MKKLSTKAFTLIELLMVIAIIGILAGILIPTVGAVRTQANKAASKSQLSQYVNAMQLFKSEYGYFPFTGKVDVESLGSQFTAALSGRPSATAITKGNRRALAFHSFSESEYYVKADDSVDDTKLADRFSNPRIFLFVDDNADGVIKPNPSSINPPKGNDGELRADVTAWVEEYPNEPVHGDLPGYSLWD